MTPTLANGKICYIEIPATEIDRSVEFYQKVFLWRIRQRNDGSIAFDDTTGQGQNDSDKQRGQVPRSDFNVMRQQVSEADPGTTKRHR